jgi:6-phospho-3-hexuloisomerase
MNLHAWIQADLDEVTALLSGVDPAEADQLGQMLLAAEGVFVTGQGRSGLAMRAFAQRLMQLGARVFVAGDAVTPAIRAGDLLVIASGSGETPGSVNAARLAREVGAQVVLLTANRGSTIGRLADHVVFFRGGTPKVRTDHVSRLPLGSVLEQSLLIFLDALAAQLAEEQSISFAEMMTRHANLE